MVYFFLRCLVAEKITNIFPFVQLIESKLDIFPLFMLLCFLGNQMEGWSLDRTD